MNQPELQQPQRTKPFFGRALVLLGVMAGLLAPGSGMSAEPVLTKYQVQAVFLLNFVKYVDWPPKAFADTNAPVTIGVLGTDPFGDELRQRVAGKTIKGRAFVIKYLAADAEMSGCQILFICDSEAARMGDILNQARALPILTVGEHESFARHGGIIHFVLKKDNVRLEIDLASARQAGVTISSKLLAVADVVKGKPD